MVPGSLLWLKADNSSLSTSRRVRFDVRDLLDAAGVAASFEGRVEPDVDQRLDAPLAEHIGSEAEYVQVIVAAAHLGHQLVVAGRGPHAGKLVGHDRHTDARAADQNATFRVAATDLLRDDRRVVGIVDAVGA